MNSLLENIQKTAQKIDDEIIDSPESAEAFRIKYLGSKGLLKSLMSEMKNVAPEDKKAMGQKLNTLKDHAEKKYSSYEADIGNSTMQRASYDWSLPADAYDVGSLHPISIIQNKIIEIFSHIGFSVAEGPEIEDDWHNFSALNLPADHPARDMQDTFFVHQDPDWMLRTHTSSVQIRTMENSDPPIRKIFPGRVYRNETISARAHCFFHQVEGLYIDKNVSFKDLKETLYYFSKEMFSVDTELRFRPSYFPFTEPSAELDVTCFICGGDGCNICKHSGWVEVLGCGMVHPNVLKNCNIDPEVYSGFAFGMGIERTTMMRYGINDLRYFSENDVRFLRQFAGVQS